MEKSFKQCGEWRVKSGVDCNGCAFGKDKNVIANQCAHWCLLSVAALAAYRELCKAGNPHPLTIHVVAGCKKGERIATSLTLLAMTWLSYAKQQF